MPIALSEPGIYNALDTAYAGGMLLLNGGVANAMALQACINYAQSQGGGIVIIPSTDATGAIGAYSLESLGGAGTAAVTIPDMEGVQPLLICGTSNATSLVMLNSGDVFDVTSNSWVTFQDLTITYHQPAPPTSPLTGTAFNFSPGGGGTDEGYRLFRVNIVDCQYPVNFNSPYIATMLECAIEYTAAYPDQVTIGIQISGTQIAIQGCTLLLFNGGTDSATTGISIVGATAYARITDTYIATFQTGISIGQTGTVQAIMLSNVQVASPGYCVQIQVTGTNASVADASFVGCYFQADQTSGSTGPAILIGTNAQDNKKIDTLRFVSCTVFGISGNGMEIQSGRNIQVIGGDYSGNGQTAGAGIAITGAATAIQIEGVNCIGPSLQSLTVQQYGIVINAGQDIQIMGANCSGNGTSSSRGIGIYVQGSESATPSDIRIVGAICTGGVFTNASEQQYGISVGQATDVYVDGCTLTDSIGSNGHGLYIDDATDVFVSNSDLSSNPYALGVTGSSQNVYVNGCNFKGSSSGALQTDGTSTLQIINSSGYNDLATVLTPAPPNGSTFIAPTYLSYYGPVTLYAANAPTATISTITIKGTITHLTQGEFNLGAAAPNGSGYAGDTAAISWTGLGTPYFLVIGK